ncbi:MAG: isoaspartyl peptidase/L-asparaginase [Pirellulaceae bacterium]
MRQDKRVRALPGILAAVVAIMAAVAWQAQYGQDGIATRNTDNAKDLANANSVSQIAPRYAIVIHGGAGSSPAQLDERRRRGREQALERVLRKGVEILKAGGTSLDAVEQVIRLLEDDPVFNAGRGAVFNNAGGHELDASIMDGRDLSCGAVAGVKTVKNPISVARLVMTKTPHVLLAGDGADRFAKQMGVKLVAQTYFSTEAARQRWERARKAKTQQPKKGAATATRNNVHYGTVGCVALDRFGNIAAGTSTGGLTNKQYGRVGDSPIVGAGTYADNRTCGVSCTGIGEHYIRNAVAYDVSARMKYLKSGVQEAVNDVITKTLKPGYGGIIALDAKGQIATGYNTGGMTRGMADSTGRFEVKIGK